MKVLVLNVFFLATVGITCAPANAGEDPVFREPFTLKLHIDKERFYEEKFGKVPFVDDGKIYLFKGDELGFDLDIQDNFIRKVIYRPGVKKVDVTLKFTQVGEPDGTAMMMLRIHNNTKHTLYMDALMTVPGREDIAKTGILPVGPGLSGIESWPHPIVQLLLRNVRIAK